MKQKAKLTVQMISDALKTVPFDANALALKKHGFIAREYTVKNFFETLEEQGKLTDLYRDLLKLGKK